MIRCYLFNGQITTDTVEMMLLATITYEVTIHLYTLYINTGKQTQAQTTNKQSMFASLQQIKWRLSL